MSWRWRLPWRRDDEAAEAAERARRAEEDLRQARRRTAAMEQLAREVGRLSSDDFIERISRAFGRLP